MLPALAWLGALRCAVNPPCAFPSWLSTKSGFVTVNGKTPQILPTPFRGQSLDRSTSCHRPGFSKPLNNWNADRAPSAELAVSDPQPNSCPPRAPKVSPTRHTTASSRIQLCTLKDLATLHPFAMQSPFDRWHRTDLRRPVRCTACR